VIFKQRLCFETTTSQQSIVIFLCFTVKPEPVSGKLRTSDLDQDSVTLSWQPPLSDGGSPITKYAIEYRDSTSPTWKPMGDVPKSTTTYRVKDLVEGTEYDFRIFAENAVGRSTPVETDKSVKPMRELGMALWEFVDSIFPQSFI